MGDYTSRVSLDTTNYEGSIRRLLGIVQTFNREAERTDRLQHLLANSASRGTKMYEKQAQAIARHKEAQKNLQQTYAQLTALAGRMSFGTPEHKKATKAAQDHKKALDDITAKLGQLEKLTKFSDRTRDISNSLAMATRKLHDFQEAYAHFGALKGMKFGEGLRDELKSLGIAGDQINRVMKQAEAVRKQYAKLFSSGEFQEAMRLDKVLGNADRVMGEFKKGYADLTSAMQPYIARSNHAKRVQAEIVDLIEKEAALRSKIASGKYTGGWLTRKEKELGGIGDTLFEKQTALSEISAAKMQYLAQRIANQRRYSIPSYASHDDQTKMAMLQYQLQGQLGSLTGADPYDVIQRLHSRNAKERAEARETYSTIASLIQQMEQLRESAHKKEMSRIQQERLARQTEHDRVKQANMERYNATAANKRVNAQRFAGLGLYDDAVVSKEDRITHAQLLNQKEMILRTMAPKEQSGALARLQSEDIQIVAKAREEYAALYAVESNLAALHDRMAERQRLYTQSKREEAKQTAAQTKQAEKQAKAAEQLEAYHQRRRAILDMPFVQNMVPSNQSFGVKAQMWSGIEDVASAFAKTEAPLSNFEHVVAEIRRGNMQMIRDFPKVAQALRRVEVAAHEADRATQKFALTTGSIVRLTFARLLTTVFYNMTGQMYETWRVANEVSETIARIETISRQMPLTTDQWRKSVRDLSTEYNLAQEDVAKALYDTVSNQISEGFGAVDINRIIGPFALTTGSSLADSVNLISSALNSFNLEATDAEEVAAQLFSTIDLGRVTAADMANTYGRLGTFAKQANISMAETNAMIARLTISGLKFERASTFIINVLNKLAKPTPAFKGFLGELGANSGEEALAIYGLPGILQKIFDANQGSLDELGDMVKDIRAMIGYSGLLKDLPGLQKAIDEISGSTLENYHNATRTVMESSAFIVGRETKKIKAFYLDLADVVLNASATITRAIEGTPWSLLTAGMGPLEFAGRMAVVGPMATAPWLGARALRDRTFGGDYDHTLTTVGAMYEAASGSQLTRRQRAAKAVFMGRAASRASALQNTAGQALPGVLQAGLFAAPRYLGWAGLAATAGYLGYQAAPVVDRMRSNWKYGNDITKAGKGFEDIAKGLKEVQKATEETTKAMVKSITLEFGAYIHAQEQLLQTSRTQFDKNIDLFERGIKTEQHVLGATEKFLLGRNQDNIDFQVGMYKRPEDQMFARMNILAAQRGTIMNVAGANPELSAELLDEWFGQVQSLRGAAMQFAQDGTRRNRMLGGNMLNMVDAMSNEFIQGIMRQLGVSPTGDLMTDVLSIRQATDSRDTMMKDFQELNKFLQDRIDKGLDSWQRTADAVSTLSDTQQALFAKFFGNADIQGIDAEGNRIYSPNAGPTTLLGRNLYDIVTQQNVIDESRKQMRYSIMGAKGRDYSASFDSEIQRFLNSSEPNSFGKKLMETLGASIIYLGNSSYDQRFRSLQANIGNYREAEAQAMASGGLTDAVRSQATDVIREIANLSNDVSRTLTDKTAGRSWYNPLRYNWGWTHNENLMELMPSVQDMAQRSIYYGKDDPFYKGYLRARTADFTEEDAKLSLVEGRYARAGRDMSVDANTVQLSAATVNVLNAGGNVYKAAGGTIGGPRGTDIVPAWLTPGEFVVNAKSAAQHYDLLQAINRPQYFDGGGLVASYNGSVDPANMPLWWRKKYGYASGGYNGIGGGSNYYDPAVQYALAQQRAAELAEWQENGRPGGASHRVQNNGKWRRNRIQEGNFQPLFYDMSRRANADINEIKKAQVKRHGNSADFLQWRRDHATREAGLPFGALDPTLTSFYGRGPWKLPIENTGRWGLGPWGIPYDHDPRLDLPITPSFGKLMALPGYNDADPRLLVAELAKLRFAEGGRVPRAYNVRGGRYYSNGGSVSNSTTVNANINLTSTGSTPRDAREIVRGINREAHRGGVAIRTT